MGHPFRPPGFGTITMHTGITGITELAVNSDLTVMNSNLDSPNKGRGKIFECYFSRALGQKL
jgi:hypothetical protein